MAMTSVTVSAALTQRFCRQYWNSMSAMVFTWVGVGVGVRVGVGVGVGVWVGVRVGWQLGLELGDTRRYGEIWGDIGR